MQEKIKEQILASASMKEAMVISCTEDIESAANLMIHSIRNSGKILWCGNGGSAGDAQHLATELMGGMTSHERKPIPSIALTTDSISSVHEITMASFMDALAKICSFIFSSIKLSNEPRLLIRTLS